MLVKGATEGHITRDTSAINYLKAPSYTKVAYLEYYPSLSGAYELNNDNGHYLDFGHQSESIHKPCAGLWLSARLQSLSCWRTGDTAVLHLAIDMFCHNGKVW